MEMDERTTIIHHEHLPSSPESTKSDLNKLAAEPREEDEKTKSNVPMTSFNFINSIIGSGIIGIPYALHQAGFYLGIILIMLVAAITDYSLLLLIRAGNMANVNSYQNAIHAAFGRPGFLILTFIQMLYPMIAMISYNVIIGDTITKIVKRLVGDVISETIIGRREFVIVATTLIITLPLSLYRNISRLSKFALVSIVIVMTLITLIVTKAFLLDIPNTEDAYQFANTGITSAIGVMAFAYMCHHNSFLLYDALHDPTLHRWGLVTHISVGFSMVCTLFLGIAGYLTFTGYSQGDILENYCHTDDLMNVARILFAFTIMLTYPIECFVVREVIENAIFAFSQPPPLWRHLIITIAVVVVTCAVSMATDCLGIVLEFNGVVNACPLAFIFPAAVYLKLQDEKILSIQHMPAILTVLFGVTVMILGIVQIGLEFTRGITCSHGHEMAYCFSSAAGNDTITEAAFHMHQTPIL